MNKKGSDKRSGLSIASLVTGILSILSFFGGIALGIAGIVCGAIDLNRINYKKLSKYPQKYPQHDNPSPVLQIMGRC